MRSFTIFGESYTVEHIYSSIHKFWTIKKIGNFKNVYKF